MNSSGKTHEYGAFEAWLTWTFSPTISAIIATLLVSTLLPIIIHIYLYRQASKRKSIPTFLLVGPSGGGKTSLLTLFTDSTPTPTHTSQAPTLALCRLPASTKSSADRYRSENDTSSLAQPPFNLLDTPGHGKLRHHAVSSINGAPPPQGIIFVLDSAAPSLNESATYLHDILLLLQKRHTQSKSSKGPTSIPVLLAANKQDIFTALPAKILQSRLEDEITKIRASRSRGLMDSGMGTEDDAGGNDDDETNWLGEYASKKFSFAQMEEHGVEVTVLGGNVRGEEESEEGRVGEWWSWIGERI